MNEIIVGRWAVLHRDHPSAESLMHRMTLPNPEWERNEALGLSNRGVPRKIKLYETVGKQIRFPRAVVNPFLGSSQYVIEDQTSAGERYDIRSLITLRERQVPFVDELEAALRKGYGAVGQAEAGFGKTICSLELIARLGVKTIILVHKEFLMTQWVERILGTKEAAKKLGLDPKSLSADPMPPMLDLHPDQVGIVQQDVCEWEGKAVVIAMAQSLLAREYPASFYESFGMVLVDEVHRFAAPTFQKTIVMFPARWRLGVTATPDRNDGLEDIFFGHIGKVAAVGEGRKTKPRINLVKTPVILTEATRQQLKRRGRDDMQKVLTYLTEHEARNRQIVTMLVKAAQAGRKVIVLSHRRKHLELLREWFIEECRRLQLGASTDYYVGGMDLEARKRAEKMQVLFATYAMAKEGLDIPLLDTLFMVTPIGDVEQPVGRINREVEGKKEPVVVDFVDVQIGLCRSLAGRREREYRARGWL